MSSAPRVTIVMATYNRSNVLACAIETVLWQTISDWELWVIGDACTDDSEAVVHAFADRRIHWYNLQQNCGEQSGPNNEGVRRARGQYIAYLNHDDLWFPDHLECALAELDATHADMVITLQERILPGDKKYVEGVFPNRTFIPGAAPAEASSWVFRKKLADAIGPWRPYREIYDTPISDWKHRVWKAGKQVSIIPRLTVIAINSAPNSYRERPDQPHRARLAQMREDPEGLRGRELAELLFHQAEQLTNKRLDALSGLKTTDLLFALGKHWLRQVASALRINHSALGSRLRGQGRGQAIRRLRDYRGLPSDPNVPQRASILNTMPSTPGLDRPQSMPPHQG